MIGINNLTIQFSGTELFSDISFMVDKRDSIGLAGKNGAGKSTLLKAIIGEIEAEKGIISKPSGITIGYLPQQMIYSDTKNVYDETKSTFEEINSIEIKINKINESISIRNDYESSDYLNEVQLLSEANERFAILGGNDIESKIEQTLIGLGFKKTDFIRPTKEFSGGWRMRIELAKILLKESNILLLDEPTNHLDIESIQWLEDFLINYKGAIVLISHDKTFLDKITKRTVEIVLGKIYDYKAAYSKYLVLREERKQQQLAAYENQQKVINDTKKFIERFRYKATKAVQVQSRIKQLEKLDIIEIDDEDFSSLHFKFPPAPRSGTIVVETENLNKSYGEKKILNNINIIIERGEKVAFVGQNGEGKTTLARVIVNELDFTGKLKLGHNVQIGYFAQNQDELLNPNKTVFQTLDDIAVGDVRLKTRSILGSFLFGSDAIDKKVSVLSGGERSRLALAKLLLEPYSLLVLDEPTNHLDIKSKEILKQALNQYDGTLIIISHDRDFLDGLTNKIYEFKNNKIKEHLSGIFEFMQKIKVESLKEIEKKETIKKSARINKSSNNKDLYIRRKEFEKEVRKIRRQIKQAETTIENTEKEIELSNKKLSDTNADYDYELFTNHEKKVESLNKEMEKWEILNETLEKLEHEKEFL